MTDDIIYAKNKYIILHGFSIIIEQSKGKIVYLRHAVFLGNVKISCFNLKQKW